MIATDYVVALQPAHVERRKSVRAAIADRDRCPVCLPIEEDRLVQNTQLLEITPDLVCPADYIPNVVQVTHSSFSFISVFGILGYAKAKVGRMTGPSRIDLNLARVLDALLRTGSVSRTAATLGLAQPTVSNAL